MESPVTPERLLAHTGWMRSLARSLVRDESLADDLVQETLLAAVERPPRASRAIGAWLRTVLRNFAYRRQIEERRRSRRERAVSRSEISTTTPEELIERVEWQRQLVDLALGLEEPLRTTILLRFFEELSPREIAVRQDVDVTTVRWRLRNGLDRLRRRLDRAHGSREGWRAALVPLFQPSTSAELAGIGGSGTRIDSTTSALIRWAVPWSLGAITVKTKAIVVAVCIVLVCALLATRSLDVRDAGDIFPLSQNPGGRPDSSEKRLDPPVMASTPPGRAEESGPTKAVEALQEGFSVRGVVTDAETGAPVPGALIRLRGESPTASTDDEGGYVLGDLGPGDHFVMASAEGYAEAQSRIRLGDEEGFRSDFQLDPAMELAVTVVDTEGRPIEGVRVTMSQPGGDYRSEAPYSQLTDVDGRVLLEGINRRSPQQINARKDGYQEIWTKDYRIDAAGDRAEMSIVLNERPSLERVISGRVTDREDRALSDVSVQWIHSWGEHRGREIAVTDRKGRYRLSFESEGAIHTISVFAEGYAPLIRGGVATGVPASPAQVDFVLEDSHWLAGRVIAETGETVSGAVVEAMPSLDWLRNPNIHPGIVRKATTDEDGRFELGDVSGPTVAIRLRGPAGGNWGHNVNENVPVDQEVELRLLSFGVIRGRVVDDDTGEPVPAFRIRIAGGRGYLNYVRTRPGELFDSPDGSFVLKKLDQEPHDLWIEPEGYISLHVAKINPEREAVASLHEFRVTRGRPVTGIVLAEETGLPLPGAKVVFGVWSSKRLSWSEWAWGEMANRQEAITGDDGAFEFIESAAGTLFLLAAGYARRSIPPPERERFDDGSGRLRVPLSTAAVLEGVHYQDGQPCSSGYFLPMLVHREGVTDSDTEVETLNGIRRDAEGRFRVESLFPGTYFLDHYRQTPNEMTGGLVTRRRVAVEPGKVTFLEYGKDLGRIQFAGRLVDAGGRPLDRVHLVLRPGFDWPYERFSAPVERKHGGRFWFTGLKPGIYQAEVRREGQGEPIRLGAIDLARTTERDLMVATD